MHSREKLEGNPALLIEGKEGSGEKSFGQGVVHKITDDEDVFISDEIPYR